MKRSMQTVTAMLVVAGLLSSATAVADSDKPDGKTKFARTTVDFGIVASDVEESLKFYKKALGLREVQGFDVPAKLGEKAGLSDYRPFHVHVLVLGDDETATKVKLMEFPQAPGKRTDQSHIHSTYGISYLTMFVENLTPVLKRAKKHDVKPIAEGPVELPDGQRYLAIVRDPDGNFIELVGPKK